MKKWIVLLLVAVMCLSLAACGNGKTEDNSGTSQGQTTDHSPQDTDEPRNAELTEQTVEITLDNWQEYFEFRPVAYENKNSYNEITGMEVDYKFFPKEAIAENITVPDAMDDDRIVFDVQYIDPYACVYRYDLNTQELTIGEFTEGSSSYSEGDLLPSHDWSGTYDSGIDSGYFPKDGYWVITEPLNVRDMGTIKDNIIEAYGYAFSSVEITRIKGTITILK